MIPADRDAERAVLGAALVGSKQVVDAADMLQPRDFYDMRHGTIWEAICGLSQQMGPIDPVTVSTRLGSDLQRVGGAPYLAELVSVEVAPHPGSLLRYAERVVDVALRRRLAEAGQRVTALAQSGMDGTEAAETARQTVDEAASQARTTDVAVSVAQGMADAIDWLETPPVGAATPWIDVNDVTNGLLAGQMITVAARPGHGKSLALKEVAMCTALQGKPVHIATLEMSRNEYMARILAGVGRVNLGHMLQRKMGDDEWDRIRDATERVRDLPLWLDDRPLQSMAQIRAAARQTQRKYQKPLGLIGIDYAQLVEPSDRRVNREQQVSEISRRTKLLAKEFGCPVMLLAQLNRGNTQRMDHTPLVSDLRESGSLEQDSDQVWLLHRPDQYGVEVERPGEVDLIVGKNRNGQAPVSVALRFFGHYAQITNLA